MTTLDTTTTVSTTRQQSFWQLANRFIGLVYLLILIAVLGAIKPAALSVGSLTTILQLSIPLLIVATGMTFCLICGEVDLSVAGTAGLASTVMALQLSYGAGWPIAVALGLFVGLAMGMINGALTAWLAKSFPVFPSFLVTLGTLSVTLGVAQAMQPLQQPVAINDPAFRSLFGFTASILGTYPVWYAIAVLAAAYFVLSRSRFGYAVYAVGTNSRAAQLTGFNVLRTKFWVMTISGLLAAFGGILLAGYVQAGFFAIAKELEIDAIAAAVIGGTALFGGRGTVLGTVIGVLTLGALNTGLLILGTETQFSIDSERRSGDIGNRYRRVHAPPRHGDLTPASGLGPQRPCPGMSMRVDSATLPKGSTRPAKTWARGLDQTTVAPAYGAAHTSRSGSVLTDKLRTMRRSADQSGGAGIPLVLPRWLQWDSTESGWSGLFP